MVELPTWTIHNMQEMNSTICGNAEEGTTGQLTDLRDGKTYWVTKLEDNNCWMTQNLALDLSTSKDLTSADSDVSDNWTPTASTQQGVITIFPSAGDLTFSFNPGEYIYTIPTVRNSCEIDEITSLSQCTDKGWQLVDGLGRDANNNEWAHYLVGNYYSYTVATTGYAINDGDAPSSICPRGWQLPVSNNTTVVDKSFEKLFMSYGVNDGLLYGTQDIRLAPLYFVYGGFAYDSSLYRAGGFGYYWSSTANFSTNAYNLDFYTIVTPAFSSARYLGMSVRCVAR